MEYVAEVEHQHGTKVKRRRIYNGAQWRVYHNGFEKFCKGKLN